MSGQLSLEEATALLLEEFHEKGGDRLPPTAYNKILHFVEKRLERKEVDADIPLFWYMFGRVAATSNSDVYVHSIEGKQAIGCDLPSTTVDASDLAVREARAGVKEGLNLYFERGLDGLIRVSYEDAPYDVQRTYLDLKAQMETEADENQATFNDYATDKNEGIRSLLYEFVENFPGDDFEEIEKDLHTWYRLLSAELDSDDYDSSRALQLTERFWRLFSLELASRQNNGLSDEEIAAELNNVESISAEKSEIRDWFAQEEKAKTRQNARHDEIAREAAEAVMATNLNLGVGI